MSQNTRKSNLELLRIIGIYLIIITHFAGYSGFKYDSQFELNAMVIRWFHVGGKLGVNLFVLISSYFLVQRKKFELKKLVMILLEVLFYSIAIIIVGKSFNLLKNDDIKRIFFAFPMNNWAFVTYYCTLYLIHPLLNKCINSVSDKTLIKYWFVLLVMWSFIPTFTKATFGLENGTLWYIYLYFTGALIRKTENLYIKTSRYYIAKGFLYYFLAFALQLFVFLTLRYTDLLKGAAGRMRDFNSILLLLSGCNLFIGFLKLDIKHSTFINTIASTTLGVFLMHDSNLRTSFWQLLIRGTKYANSPFLFIYGVVVSFAILFICSFIDYGRKILIENSYKDAIGYLCDKLQVKFDLFFDKINKIII